MTGFRPHLDGLRAVAVLLVVLYHAGIGFPGGYVGVDVFLVLSGFLVTALLVREHSGGRISLLEFWARRARRLLPAAALVAVATVVLGQFLLEPQRLRALAGDVFAVGTFTANLRFQVTHGDYLGGLTLPSPLLHFWSLALEEQFYLVWPLVLVGVLRLARRPGRLLPGLVVAALLAASLVTSVVLTPPRPSAAYYLLPSRAWEFLAGALLALCWSPARSLMGRMAAASSGLGLLLVIGSAVLLGSGSAFPGWLAAIPVAGTLLVLLSDGSGPVGRLLATSPFVWLGARSYGVYLWHWPVLVLAGARFPGLQVWQRLLLVVLSLPLADVSFRVLEAPVRRSPVLAASGLRSVGLGLVCTTVVLVSGLFLAATTPTWVASVADRDVPSAATTPVPTGSPASISEEGPLPVPVVGTSPPPRVLLLGDSTLAPLRWFEEGSRSLERLATDLDVVVDAESCRRLGLRSCIGREDRRPEAAAAVLDTLTEAGDRFPVVVLMAGYHSTPAEFTWELDSVLAAAARHGVETLFFVNFRESLAFPLEGSNGRLSVFGEFNDVLRTGRPDGVPRLVVLDWNGFSRGATGWFREDGIHVNLAGALGLGEFLVRSTASALGRSCGTEAMCLPPTVPDQPALLLQRFGVTSTDRHCYEMGASRLRECREDHLR